MTFGDVSVEQAAEYFQRLDNNLNIFFEFNPNFDYHKLILTISSEFAMLRTGVCDWSLAELNDNRVKLLNSRYGLCVSPYFDEDDGCLLLLDNFYRHRR